MKALIVATSAKPPDFERELRLGTRYRLEYLKLSECLGGSYMDYDPPWMHEYELVRQLEERTHADFYWAQLVARRAKREGYDVVISMSERVAVPLAFLLDRRIQQVAILINALSAKWLFVIKLLKLHRGWEHIITYSRAEAAALRDQLAIKPGKITPVLNYVDTEFFKPSANRGEGRTEPFIMSQGLAKRDYPTLIQAMATLPHIECHISAVSAWDDFRAGYEGLEIPSNVHLKSYNHPSVIRDALERCRFLVIPLQPHVGMWCSGSTSVLQAQAMGKPVIVTYLPGIAEYVRDGESGLLVEGGNPKALAAAIDRLWQEPQLARAMGQRGQKWVQQCFTLEKWIANIAEVLDKVTYGRSARPEGFAGGLSGSTEPTLSSD